MKTYGKILSTMTTAGGTKVTRYLESVPSSECYKNCFKKLIEYPKDSRMAQLGIDSVIIRDTMNEGKRIIAGNGDKRVLIGETKPRYGTSVVKMLKDYINNVRAMNERI